MTSESEESAVVRLPLDGASIERLQSSLGMLLARGESLSACFYRRLFEREPGVRAMFPADMRAQERKLIESLVLVVDHLREPERVAAMLRDLGRRHVRYGVRPEHYPLVCGALLEAMSEAAGDGWTGELAAEWALALELVSASMIRGGGGCSASG